MSTIKMAVGIDIVEISDFKESMNDRIIKRIFTSHEIGHCRNKCDPMKHFAARFAAKEAIIKAFSFMDIGLTMDCIEINNQIGSNIPSVSIDSTETDGFHVQISLSHSARSAIASALVLQQ